MMPGVIASTPLVSEHRSASVEALPPRERTAEASFGQFRLF
jgi:hypothetical protein